MGNPPPDHPLDGEQYNFPSTVTMSPLRLEGQDVLELCREAASMLGPNEMIHDADFSLHSAMSALELMDAKMDKPPPALESLERRIAAGTLPLDLDESSPLLSSPPSPPPVKRTNPSPPPPPSPPATTATLHDDSAEPGPSRRALAVLDGMTVCEAAWHEGGSLPETLYACLYLHPAVFSAVMAGLGWAAPAAGRSAAPPRLDMRISEGRFPWKPVDRALTLAVLAQSLATLRCCSLARDVILLADIFEEEDFYPASFGFRLAPPIEDDSLVDLLALAEGAMRERIKSAELHRTRTNQKGGNAAGGDSGTSGSTSGRSNPDECILAHLESRTQLLQAFLALRDAFTNKQRLRRLRALERRRAEESGNGSGRAVKPDVTAEAATEAEAEGSAAGLRIDGRPLDPAGQRAVEVGRDVVSAAAGLAVMSIGRKMGDEQSSSGGADGPGSAGSVDDSATGQARRNGGPDGVECDAEVAASAEAAGKESLAVDASGDGGNGTVRLVIEGKAVAATREQPIATSTSAATATPTSAAPCDDGVILERVAETEEVEPQQQPGDADDDIETPLGGISRCESHLRAAAAALESLLAIESSLEANPGTPPIPSPTGMAAHDQFGGLRGGAAAGGSEAAAAEGAMAAAANGGAGKDSGGQETPSSPPEGAGFKLGGAAGSFAFEPEMNRHLLGSSPQHHVHFRRGRADGPRALMLLAREAGRACGVVRCEDLLDARWCLARLYQPPTESNGGPAIGTASLFARSVAAVCLYRQDMVLGRFDLITFVADAMSDVGVPDAVINSPAGMAFLERVGMPVYETLRTLCLNRARQRTSLELQMQDWRTLQAYAETVDDAFQLQYGLSSTTQRYMSKWALCEVLGLMHRYLQIGVELQLPSPHEWLGVYWYWDYVIATKAVTEGSLRESKEQLEVVKAQMEKEEREAEQREAREAKEAADAATAAASAAAAATQRPLPHAGGAAGGGTGGGGSGGGAKKTKKKKRGGGGSKGKKNATTDARVVPTTGGGLSGADAAGTGSDAGVDGPVAAAAGGGSCADKREASPPAFGKQKTPREISWEARRDWETADMKLRQHLCRGTVRLIAGLESLGMMGRKAGEWPEFRFTSPEILHRERFRAFQALDMPAFQPHDVFLNAVDFDEGEAVKVVEASAECFRAARTLALELMRRGDSAAKGKAAESSVGAAAAAATAAVPAPGDVAAGGGANGTPPLAAPGKAAAAAAAAGSGDYAAAIRWASDSSELLAIAKLAVSNGVAAMQVVKRVSAAGASASASASVAAAAGKGRSWGGAMGRAKLDFGSNSQFPVVNLHFS